MHVLEPIPFSRTNVRAKNRTLLAAMTNKQSLDDGRLSEDEIHWLVRRAKGGFGITTTAAANVTKTGRGWEGEMGVWGDHQLGRVYPRWLCNSKRQERSLWYNCFMEE